MAAPTPTPAGGSAEPSETEPEPGAGAPLPVLTGLFSSPTTAQQKATPIINPLAGPPVPAVQPSSGSLTWLWVLLGVLGLALVALLLKLLGVF